jgi:hypothetical protein
MSKRYTSIPAEFEARFLEHLDQRSRVARIIRERLDAVADDLGGMDSLSYAKRSLLRRAIWLELVIEQREVEASEGKSVDLGQQTQMLNALIGLWRTLGLERKPRDIQDLRSYISRSGEQ